MHIMKFNESNEELTIDSKINGTYVIKVKQLEMKYLIGFNNFLLLEEADLKYSKSGYDEIFKMFNDCIEEFDKLENFDAETGEKIDKEKYAEKFYKLLKINIHSLLYPKFTIQLGAVILQKRSETESKFDDEFLNDVKESIKLKKLNTQLMEYLNKVLVGLWFCPYYKESETNLSFGSLGSYKSDYALKSKDLISQYSLKLNLLNDERIREEIKETIRHELQHLTQNVNSFCLKLGEKIINQNGINLQTISKDVVECYESKKSKFGGGKTKTGLNQGDEVANYDSQTGKETNLKKKLNLDISSEEGKKKAKSLQYLLDDKEYKPWISDKVDDYIKKWQKHNQENIDKYKMLYKYQVQFNLNESLSEEQQKKINQKKELNSLSKKFNMSYNDLIKTIKSFSIEDVSNKLTKILLDEDMEIKIIKQYRKELSTDVTKLFNLKLKKIFNDD